MRVKFFSCIISGYIRNYTNTSTKRVQKAWGGVKNKKSYPKTLRERIKWTEEQKAILEKAKLRYSMFITGSAGSGKTILLKEIIKSVKKFNRVVVTASTGAAACALKGQTLHSFAGVGQAAAKRDFLLQRVLGNEKAIKRWNDADTLVIDEISMVDAVLFDDLEYIARYVRDFDEPWGGLQLIVCGDFLQLPPVIDQKRSSKKEFAFEADCWDASFQLQVELTKVFRQSDSRLIKLLQGIRRGETDTEDLRYLKQTCSVSEPDPSVVRLFPRIKDVEKVNDERMQDLGNKIIIYEALDYGSDPWKQRLKQCQAPECVKLCEGARVMLIKNLDPRRRLVNGATGVITGFIKSCSGYEQLPIVKFDFGQKMVIEPDRWEVMEGDKVVAWRWQIPLILAWALSIHKCQGMTLDKLHTDLSSAFGCGMVYVALSRVRSLEGLHLSGFSPRKIKAHPKVLEFYRRFDRLDKVDNDEDGCEKEDQNSDLREISDKTTSIE